MRRIASVVIATLFFLIADLPNVRAADLSDWGKIEKDARGQTVYFNAWGGAGNINDYIAWAGDTVEKRFGVKVVHVKLDDTANAVAKVVAEKAAGHEANGSIDLIWINGENFAAMKRQGLLLTPGWADKLPNWRYVDWKTKPTVLTDFTVPTDGQEAPWGMAKLVFIYDTARDSETGEMPDSFADLVDCRRPVSDDRGMSVGVAEHHRPDAHRCGQRSDRSQRCGRFQVWRVFWTESAAVAHEMVPQVDRVPAGLIGETGDVDHVLPTLLSSWPNGKLHETGASSESNSPMRTPTTRSSLDPKRTWRNRPARSISINDGVPCS